MPNAETSDSSAPTTVRLPEPLRNRLAEQAARRDVSFNAEVVRRLQASFGPSASTVERAFEALNLPKAIRMNSSSTTADCMRLITVAEQLGAQSLLLGAKANDLNNAVLVAVIETPQALCVMDSTWINIARPPRQSEVEQLFQRFDSLGLLDHARACTVLVPDTSKLPAVEAAETIAREGKPERMDVRRFLNLLAQTRRIEDIRPYQCLR